MSETPYRDLGGGFARLTGVEGARRAPSRIRTVEDALRELVRNAVDAGAQNIYVATSLHARRYREMILLDDGRGIPEPYRDRIFEPGVTTRHLSPSRTAGDTHGAGLSLYHLRESALSTEALSTQDPTSIRAVFDTDALPERDLQSTSRASHSNLLATLRTFVEQPPSPEIYHGSPASILALLLRKRIIPANSAAELERWCEGRMGVSLSRRTLQRVLKGQVALASRVEVEADGPGIDAERGRDLVVETAGAGGRLQLEQRDLDEIRAVLERAARESYLQIGGLDFHAREGEVVLKARVYEAEEEYDE